MMPDAIALFATIVLLLPMGYFLLAAPAFLLVKLDIPPVARLLRGMFNAYFLALTVAGVIAMVAFAAERRPDLVIGIGAIAAFAFAARRWFLRRMDLELETGDAEGARHLRRLHWGGMLCNAVLVVAVVGSTPYLTSAPA